jgi:hypothetical protein
MTCGVFLNNETARAALPASPHRGRRGLARFAEIAFAAIFA